MSARTSDSDVPKKSGRAGKPKVRTGCITCKVRRIKCDETKPICNRCSTTGRTCDGYVVQKKADGSRSRTSHFPPVSVVIKFSYTGTIPQQIRGYPDSTPEELRSLDFFQWNTAAKLSGWLGETFWKYQLPQLGLHEPSIRHSMIAMASIHEEMGMCEARGTDPRFYGTSDARQRYAAQHAQLAMSELSKLLAARPDATEVALTNCILFVMLDFLVGNFATAVLHLHNGQEILRKWREDSGGGRQFEPGSLEHNLTQILFQLGFQSDTEGDDDHLLQGEIDDERLLPFPDLESAKRSIDYLMRDGLRIVRVGTVMALAKQGQQPFPQTNSSLDSEIATQRTRLHRWATKLAMLASNMEGRANDSDHEALDELRVTHISVMVWLELGISFDSPQPEGKLDTIINMAEGYHQRRCSLEHEYLSAHFVMEEGIAPLMFFIATKSHASDPRPRAVALLVNIIPRTNDTGHGSMSSNAEDGMRMIREKIDGEGRRVLEVEVTPMTQEVDLTFDPGADLWQVRTGGSTPAAQYRI